MATSKKLVFALNGAMPTPTHETRVAIDMNRIKHQVCKSCDLSHRAYDEAHYDLAESWFAYHQYLEFTARVFMLSGTYHRWWNQQIAGIEDEFLRKSGSREMNASQLREGMFGAIITMDIHPSSELRRRMHAEGISALLRNPSLSKLKIYRNV